MFTYLFDGFLRRVFSLLRVDRILYIYNALDWRHRFFFLSKILSAFFIRSLSPRFASLFTATSLFKTLLHPELDMRLLSPRPLFQNWFSLPLFPLTEEGATSTLGSRPIINLFFSFLGHRVQTSVGFHSIGDPFGPLSLFTRLRLQGTDSLTQFLSSFNGRPKLTYILYLSFYGQSLAAC